MLLALAALTLQSPLQSPTWQELDETSALDGRRSYIAGVESTSRVRNSIGREMAATLTVSCINSRRVVGVQWPAFMGIRGIRVRWRFDGGGIEERFLEPQRSLIPIEGRDADRFMDALASADQLVFEVTGGQGQQEATFSVSGGDEKVARVMELCPRR